MVLAGSQHLGTEDDIDEVPTRAERTDAVKDGLSLTNAPSEPTTDGQHTQCLDNHEELDHHQHRAESTSGAEPQSESPMLEKATSASFDPFRRRTRVWWILAFYLPLLILPWTLTCIMRFRPLTARSYINAAGRISPKVFETNEGWQTAVGVMNTIAAVLTIPVTSFLIAEAAVIWSQRRCESQRPLSLAQFFDLADRGWTDIHIVWREITRDRAKEDIARRNWFLLGAASFIVLCSTFLPLQQLLVRTETIQVVTCNHVPFEPQDLSYPDGWPAGCGRNNYGRASQDAQPGSMNILPLWNLKESVKASLVTANENEHQSRLWSNVSSNSDTDDVTLIDRIAPHFDDRFAADVPFWIAAVPNGTATGVLREHAMRMNSSISCQLLEMAAFPSTCPGSDPFTADYTWNRDPATDANTLQVPDISVRVCVPGSFALSKWNRSRDAITIMEEIYLGLFKPNATLRGYIDPSHSGQETFVQHCVVNTTRGYFELPNYYNDFLPQPLLHTFPGADEIAQYNDYEVKDYDLPIEVYPPYLDPIDSYSRYHVEDPLSPDMPRGYTRQYDDDDFSTDNNTYWLNAAGPLTISAVAIFGNESFFQASQRAVQDRNISSAALALCQDNRRPFLSVDRTDFGDLPIMCSTIFTSLQSNETLVSDVQFGENDFIYEITTQLLDWFGRFDDTKIARTALGIATYYASEAMLTQSANAVSGRSIYSSDGRTTQKPTFNLATAIALSILLLIEVVGLLLLAFWSWKTPTYTSTLKSVVVAQLANAMDTGTLPPVGLWNEIPPAVLHRLDGRVGIAPRGSKEHGKTKTSGLVHGGEESLMKSRRAY